MALHAIVCAILTSVMLGCSEGDSDNNISKETVNGVTWGYTVYKDGEACLGNNEHLSKTISTSTSGCITIPTTLGGHRVVGICYGAFDNCRKLRGIIIPSGITAIGDGAFMNCTGLENITIPDSVKYIGGSLFAGCVRLTSARLPDTITELPVGIFNGCARLRSFTIPSNVETIETCAFQRSGITNIIIHGKVKRIDSLAFESCNSLTEVIIGEGVESLWNDAFANCKNLSHVVIPNSVTFIGEGAFKYCDNLTHVEIPVGLSEENVRECCFKSGIKISRVNKPKTKSNIQGSDADAKLQNDQATRYYHGINVERDKAKAVALYRKAADNGYGPAQYNLAWCYENGEGIDRNSVEAERWYREAAKQGDKKAPKALYALYWNAEGVRNTNEAFKWKEIAQKIEKSYQSQSQFTYIVSPMTFMGFEFGNDVACQQIEKYEIWPTRDLDGGSVSCKVTMPRFRKFPYDWGNTIYGTVRTEKLYKIRRFSEDFPDEATEEEKRMEFKRTCDVIAKKYDVMPTITSGLHSFDEETAVFIVGQIEITLRWSSTRSIELIAIHKDFKALAKKEWREDMEKQDGADVL